MPLSWAFAIRPSQLVLTAVGSCRSVRDHAVTIPDGRTRRDRRRRREGVSLSIRDGLRCVAPSPLAVDLLTGPGREPSQGEELLGWMKDNEDAWRS
ncbi:MAG: hypothetical protein S0880_35145 [Actinomycetota bacterium]|nr:hypothetical protein [Actinomycetota bacterium]